MVDLEAEFRGMDSGNSGSQKWTSGPGASCQLPPMAEACPDRVPLSPRMGRVCGGTPRHPPPWFALKGR